MTTRRAALAGLFAFPALASAQEAWPARSLRLISPFPPGGAADVLARNIAEELTPALRQSVVVENRTGAGGSVGTEAVVRSAADGYTLLMGSTGPLAINPALLRLAYDPAKDLVPVAMVSTVASVLVVHPSVQARNLTELLAMARAKPGELNYGSSGTGSAQHLFMELLKQMTGVDITHVPYRGAAPAATDVIAGNIDGLIAAIPDVGRNERLRLLAMTTEQRLARWPDVPSVAELGLAPLVAANWFGISGPAGIPAPVADRLNAALVESLATPALTERLSELGAAPNRLDRPGFTALVAADMARWAQIVREAGIKAD